MGFYFYYAIFCAEIETSNTTEWTLTKTWDGKKREVSMKRMDTSEYGHCYDPADAGDFIFLTYNGVIKMATRLQDTVVNRRHLAEIMHPGAHFGRDTPPCHVQHSRPLIVIHHRFGAVGHADFIPEELAHSHQPVVLDVLYQGRGSIELLMHRWSTVSKGQGWNRRGVAHLNWDRQSHRAGQISPVIATLELDVAPRVVGLLRRQPATHPTGCDRATIFCSRQQGNKTKLVIEIH